MKKIILRQFGNETKWAGGVYYIKNVDFQLKQNLPLKINYKIISLKSPAYTGGRLNHFICSIKKFFSLIKCYNSYLFPSFESGKANLFCKFFKIHQINWIPDFQHNIYPQYFSEEECKNRTERFKKIINSKAPLILSSNAALADMEEYYGHKSNVYVMPFVSNIESEISSLNFDKEKTILDKYQLTDKKYICVSNQFWKHKNHIVIFKAIKELAHSGKIIDIQFVFTGYLKDYRDSHYYNELLTLVEDHEVNPYCRILGFVDRLDQIVVMKNSQFMIQPSLFEGWGTVLEDGKVLDKTILLSDIPVHREQKNDKCILFEPHDYKKLAELIDEESSKDHNDDIRKGIADMHIRAVEYSKSFERLLNDIDKKRRG